MLIEPPEVLNDSLNKKMNSTAVGEPRLFSIYKFKCSIVGSSQGAVTESECMVANTGRLSKVIVLAKTHYYFRKFELPVNCSASSLKKYYTLYYSRNGEMKIILNYQVNFMPAGVV